MYNTSRNTTIVYCSNCCPYVHSKKLLNPNHDFLWCRKAPWIDWWHQVVLSRELQNRGLDAMISDNGRFIFQGTRNVLEYFGRVWAGFVVNLIDNGFLLNRSTIKCLSYRYVMLNRWTRVFSEFEFSWYSLSWTERKLTELETMKIYLNLCVVVNFNNTHHK